MIDSVEAPIAVLDANILYPFRIRDVVLRFAEAELYQPRWSQKILDEWTTNLLNNKPHLHDSIVSQEKAIKRAFPEALVEDYQGLLSLDVKLSDEGDRHVIECAIKAGAHYIVTENIKDFSASVLAPLSIEAITADNFLAQLSQSRPEIAGRALKKMRKAYHNPPMSTEVFIEEFQRVGLSKMVGFMMDRKEMLE